MGGALHYSGLVAVRGRASSSSSRSRCRKIPSRFQHLLPMHGVRQRFRGDPPVPKNHRKKRKRKRGLYTFPPPAPRIQSGITLRFSRVSHKSMARVELTHHQSLIEETQTLGTISNISPPRFALRPRQRLLIALEECTIHDYPPHQHTQISSFSVPYLGNEFCAREWSTICEYILRLDQGQVPFRTSPHSRNLIGQPRRTKFSLNLASGKVFRGL